MVSMEAIIDEEEVIVEENVNYVLSLFDMYQNDQEIIQALRKKGIRSFLIQKILHRVKTPAYEKRIKQSKKIIKTGAALSILFTLVYIVFRNVPGASTFLNNYNQDEAALRYVFLFYREIFYFMFFVFALVGISGLFQYRKYTKLLKENADFPITT